MIARARMALVERCLRSLLRCVMVARGVRRGRHTAAGWDPFRAHRGRADRAADGQQQRKQYQQEDAEGFH